MKFGAKWSAADKEGIWEKCKVAIGQNVIILGLNYGNDNRCSKFTTTCMIHVWKYHT